MNWVRMLIPRQTEQADLIERIRKEADDARACFRTMATQALAFVPAGVAAVFVAIKFAPLAAIASFAIMASIAAIQRVAIHKFSTSNRNVGYQLHLERLSVHDPTGLRHIGWEELLRAWRIVQATVFSAVYNIPNRAPFQHSTVLADLWLPHYTLKPMYQNDAYWWMQSKRVKAMRHAEHLEHASYHAGSYLARMFSILNTMLLLCLAPPVVVAVSTLAGKDVAETSDFTRSVVITLLIIFAAACLLHLASVKRRRQILEDEMLSIHSCAIMWKAVAMAHQRAWSVNAEQRQQYTERLVRIACRLAQHPELIREWTDHDFFPPEWGEPAPPNQN